MTWPGGLRGAIEAFVRSLGSLFSTWKAPKMKFFPMAAEMTFVLFCLFVCDNLLSTQSDGRLVCAIPHTRGCRYERIVRRDKGPNPWDTTLATNHVGDQGGTHRLGPSRKCTHFGRQRCDHFRHARGNIPNCSRFLTAISIVPKQEQ